MPGTREQALSMNATASQESAESVRLFQNDILEYFSHIHPATPVVVYVPVILYFLYLALETLSAPALALAFFAGMLGWTITEYALHRHVFHLKPTSKLGKRLHFLLHGVHHDYPHDGTRLVMPLLVSVPLAFAFYYAFKAVLGIYFEGFYSGFITGYVCYDCIHYATHHFKMKNPVAKFLKAYHLRHHFVNPDSGYGVSNPLWDYVCGTVPPEK
jgi:sterol desaturase/sphingolipid hydroxylase (fatty acid hydroxylase superfamily)